MCTILISYGISDERPLVLLANRDEFYNRPTRPASRWEDHPGVFAGRDLVGMGTWLGVSDSGKIAAVTNFRDPSQPQGENSRGALVSDYLTSDSTPSAYLEGVAGRAGLYTGFNLIAGAFGDGGGELFYFSNRSDGVRKLGPGLYGLSNHLLDTPWPKVVRGKEMLADALSNGFPSKEELFRILADRTIARDEMLPDTGVGQDIERALSAIFIETPIYGTRCSTVVIADKEGRFDLDERVFV